jgi:isoleucyl-tRNA synthetase
MEAARRVVALGRAIRNEAAIKTRQPLREVVVTPGKNPRNYSQLQEAVENLKDIVLDELNVKELRFGGSEDVVAYELRPNLAVVGPKYGRLVPNIRSALAEVPPKVSARAVDAGEPVTVIVEGEEITLTPSELFPVVGQRPGYTLFYGEDLVVALRTELDGELVDEGQVRELVHKVQNLRRERGFEIEETISVTLGGSPRITSLLKGPWGDYFKAEVLARELNLDEAGTDGAAGAVDIVRVDGEELFLKMERLGKVGSG